MDRNFTGSSKDAKGDADGDCDCREYDRPGVGAPSRTGYIDRDTVAAVAATAVVVVVVVGLEMEAVNRLGSRL